MALIISVMLFKSSVETFRRLLHDNWVFIIHFGSRDGGKAERQAWQGLYYLER